MPDGVVVLNPQAEILWFNRTAARLLGLRGKGDIGLRIENLVRSPEFVRYLQRGQYALPVMLRSNVGVEQYLSMQIVPYGAGQLLALVRDVTRQARLEAMRKDFVANASHELRSPLTVISGYLETLTQDPSIDPAIAGPLQEMRRQALRMTGIVQDLLELSRLEASDRAAPSQPIDVVALMAQLRRDVLARSVHPAQVLMHADSSSMLLGEDELIHSAFANLVDNAAKYTPPEGSLQMRWWTDEQGGHFSVVDTGIGIARGPYPTPDRALLPRRQRPQPRDRRLGPGAGDRQARAAAARRAAVHREPGRPWQQFHLPFPQRSARARCLNLPRDATSIARSRRGLRYISVRIAPPPGAFRIRGRSMEAADLSHHTSTRFNEDLERVRSKVLAMGGFVEEQLGRSLTALVEGDSALGRVVAHGRLQGQWHGSVHRRGVQPYPRDARARGRGPAHDRRHHQDHHRSGAHRR